MSENQSECVHNWASCINLNISNVDISGSGIRTFEIATWKSFKLIRQGRKTGSEFWYLLPSEFRSVPHHCDPTYLAEDIWCRQQFIQVFNFLVRNTWLYHGWSPVNRASLAHIIRHIRTFSWRHPEKSGKVGKANGFHKYNRTSLSLDSSFSKEKQRCRSLCVSV